MHLYQCKFLHYKITPYILTNKKDSSNSTNQSVDFDKFVNPPNNASSNKNSKSQNNESKLTSKNLPPNQQTSNTLQQITKIIQDVMKSETINKILESLNIITTIINKIMIVTTET